MPGTVAVPSDQSVATLSDADLSVSAASPSTASDLTAGFPVSMVVHGGTGVLHGNMTSLTVNQYIGVVPGSTGGRWDPALARELVADAVKIGADANSQLFNPTKPFYSDAPSSYPGSTLLAGLRKKGPWLMMAVMVISSVVILVPTSLYNKFSPPSAKRLPAAPRLPGAPRLPSSFRPLSTPSNTSDDEVEPTSEMPMNYGEAPRMLQRSYWLARPSRGVMTPSQLPMHMVVVADTLTAECLTTDDCVSSVRNQQRFNMNNEQFQDIGFNFLIGGEGNVYVGRGWTQQGAHTKHFNEGTLGVALIGTFTTQQPRDTQMTALRQLINLGVRSHFIAANYTVVCHCQLRDDSYPGRALAKAVSALPHFDLAYSVDRCT